MDGVTAVPAIDPGVLARLRRAAEDPLLRYEPGPPHRSFLEDRARFRLLRAPSQSGKTLVAAYETIHRCLGTHPHLDTPSPPIEGRVVCHSYPQSLVIQTKVHDLLPPGVLHRDSSFHPTRGWKHKTIRFRNGSRLKFVTASQERLALASATLDLVWIDEPPPEDVYAECVSRLVQTGGVLYLTLTPIGRPLKWLRAQVEEGVLSETHYALSTASCPWMTEDQVEEARKNCLPAQRPQIIEGEWDGVTPDRFLDGFEPDKTVTPVLPTGEVDVLLGFDHGERPGAEVCLLVYFFTVEGKPHFYVCDEYVSPGRTTETQDALRIQGLLDRHHLSLYSVDRSRGDVNTAGKSAARTSMNQAFENAFTALAGSLPFSIEKPRKGPGSVLRTAQVVNRALIDGRLKIHPRCKALIESMQHWRGEPSSDLKHAIDALGYLAYDLLDTSVPQMRAIEVV